MVLVMALGGRGRERRGEKRERGTEGEGRTLMVVRSWRRAVLRGVLKLRSASRRLIKYIGQLIKNKTEKRVDEDRESSEKSVRSVVG